MIIWRPYFQDLNVIHVVYHNVPLSLELFLKKMFNQIKNNLYFKKKSKFNITFDLTVQEICVSSDFNHTFSSFFVVKTFSPTTTAHEQAAVCDIF